MAPALVVVSGAARERLDHDFARYGEDYQVVHAAGLAEAMATVQSLQARRVPVALFAVEFALPDAPGLVTLDCLHAISPTSKRIVLHSWDDYRAHRESLRVAQTSGRVDAALGVPRGDRDEEFHTAVTELLSDWGWTVGDPVVASIDLISPTGLAATAHIRDFMDRLGIPYRLLTPDAPAAQPTMDALEVPVDTIAFPVVSTPYGETLVNPTVGDIGRRLFAADEFDAGAVVDLAVVGAGPAGLAAAVYGASEGLSTVVFDADAIGGQAGSSSMIRNYLGFPRGISGMRLTQRARSQASRFGARLYSAMPVVGLVPGADGLHEVQFADGSVRARAVLISAGVSYRRLGVASVEEKVGLGVHYGAATGAARECSGQDVVVVGGGNSAGQAALHLSRFARSVKIVVRRGDLAETMSDYLIREIEANPRVLVSTHAEVVDAGGDARLEWITVQDNTTGAQFQKPCEALFLFLGAEPCCDWLPPQVSLDDKGFVLTGRDVPHDSWVEGRPPGPLATSAAGIFAAGDIRAGSMKRVAAASGEGSAVVPAVHAYLADLAATGSPPA